MSCCFVHCCRCVTFLSPFPHEKENLLARVNNILSHHSSRTPKLQYSNTTRSSTPRYRDKERESEVRIVWRFHLLFCWLQMFLQLSVVSTYPVDEIQIPYRFWRKNGISESCVDSSSFLTTLLWEMKFFSSTGIVLFSSSCLSFIPSSVILHFFVIRRQKIWSQKHSFVFLFFSFLLCQLQLLTHSQSSHQNSEKRFGELKMKEEVLSLSLSTALISQLHCV